ncbi:GyrI-like domain-containing protein [Sphingobacterium endophyticum]|uniref:GyrI-like domain-containing protein n=1 Tax=Sphingobacterium endophyticum TaxID=2546448 RepID=UPI0012E29983|nr:GyrI-like domain-containing protein [Sphingobacterium endophyticum]
MKKETIESFNVIGIAVRTCNTDGSAARDIPALWGKFMAEGMESKIPNRMDDAVYCVYTDYEGDFQYPYVTLLGCKVENLDIIPEGMVGEKIAKSNYVKIKVEGNISGDAIFNAWSRIWESDIDRSYQADFEVYSAESCQNENPSMDIFVSIK